MPRKSLDNEGARDSLDGGEAVKPRRGVASLTAANRATRGSLSSERGINAAHFSKITA